MSNHKHVDVHTDTNLFLCFLTFIFFSAWLLVWVTLVEIGYNNMEFLNPYLNFDDGGQNKPWPNKYYCDIFGYLK